MVLLWTSIDGTFAYQLGQRRGFEDQDNPVKTLGLQRSLTIQFLALNEHDSQNTASLLTIGVFDRT
jgi:hypothetical protein